MSQNQHQPSPLTKEQMQRIAAAFLSFDSNSEILIVVNGCAVKAEPADIQEGTALHDALIDIGQDLYQQILSQEAKQATDSVNHPEHYTQGGVECIDAIQAALTPEEFRGYCKGNAMKYVWRERMKGGTESLQKANWYLNRIAE